MCIQIICHHGAIISVLDELGWMDEYIEDLIRAKYRLFILPFCIHIVKRMTFIWRIKLVILGGIGGQKLFQRIQPDFLRSLSFQSQHPSSTGAFLHQNVPESLPQRSLLYLNVPESSAVQCDAGVERFGCELVSRIKCPRFHGNPSSFSGKARVVANNDQQKVSHHAASYNLWGGWDQWVVNVRISTTFTNHQL